MTSPEEAGGLRAEPVNAEHASRIPYADGRPSVGMAGHRRARRITETGCGDLTDAVSLED